MLHYITSWVDRILGRSSGFQRRPWSEFANLPAGNYAGTVAPEDLVDLASYHREERTTACGGHEPLATLSAYAQDRLAYDAENRLKPASEMEYAALPPEQKLNRFGQAYKTGTRVMVHRQLADIVVDAAIDLYKTQGWTTMVFDGLRTMESGYLLYRNAEDQWLKDGLLSPPGRSSHNRALAVDSMMFDADGREVDVGAHFDSANMEINHRNYSGSGISEAAKQNRLTRERAFMRAAINRGTVLMPLREEFWHDQMPGSEKDLWRVLESICRVIGQRPPPDAVRAHEYAAFARQWENYLNKGKLSAAFGEAGLHPPRPEQIVYHEQLKPIYDRDLPEHLQQAITDPAIVQPQNRARAA